MPMSTISSWNGKYLSPLLDCCPTNPRVYAEVKLKESAATVSSVFETVVVVTEIASEAPIQKSAKVEEAASSGAREKPVRENEIFIKEESVKKQCVKGTPVKREESEFDP